MGRVPSISILRPDRRSRHLGVEACVEAGGRPPAPFTVDAPSRMKSVGGHLRDVEGKIQRQEKGPIGFRQRFEGRVIGQGAVSQVPAQRLGQRRKKMNGRKA